MKGCCLLRAQTGELAVTRGLEVRQVNQRGKKKPTHTGKPAEPFTRKGFKTAGRRENIHREASLYASFLLVSQVGYQVKQDFCLT